MEENSSLPNLNRMSVLVALICLLYAVTPYIQFNTLHLDFGFLGIRFSYQVGFATLVSLLSAALAISGANWIFDSHPGKNKGRLFPHWLLPGLTAWAIGIPLGSLGVGTAWWIAFGFGSLMLLVVIVFEYIVIDLSNLNYPLAAIILSAIAFILYLIMVINVFSAELRLYLKLPIIFIPLLLILLRVLYLRTNGFWMPEWAFCITVVITQFALAFHYLPIQPIPAGVFLSGSAFALTSLASSFHDNRENRRIWIEPVIILAITFLLFMINPG
jgi:hypothetical protein